MCGIFGHIGDTSSIEKCLKGLKFLEYRGYDSAGIAGIEENHLFCMKEKGRICELEKLLEKKIHNFQSSIGHTRWATHGEASQKNAHPHLDQKREIAVVHNGILENHSSLRSMLEQKGMIFESETDSEVIAQLISYFDQGDFLKAVREALSLMKGFWALAIIHKNYPGQIVATRYENPLIVGVSTDANEAFVSSDPYAFSQKDLDLYYLKNHEIALISKGNVEIYDQNSNAVEKHAEHLDLPQIEITKGHFEHFMLKEIFEQPISIQSSIHNRFIMENGDAEFENFPSRTFDKVLILGCGTSWHAGTIAAQMIEELVNIPARAEIASEYRFKRSHVDKNTLVIALSQSGETFDTVSAVRKAQELGGCILAICNVPGSTLMRLAEHIISLRAGPEISVCSTKAFSCQISVLALVTLKLARNLGMSKERGQQFISEITRLPTIVETVLEQREAIRSLAKKYASHSNFFFIGRQYMHTTSLEAALKLKEISYLNAFGYPAGELKHGPIALIDSQCVVLGLCGNTITYEKMLSNLAEVKARGGKIIGIAPHDSEEIDQIADDLLYLPKICDELASIPYAVATQLFAYYIALERGTEIDQPRNLAKSVTVE